MRIALQFKAEDQRKKGRPKMTLKWQVEDKSVVFVLCMDGLANHIVLSELIRLLSGWSKYSHGHLLEILLDFGHCFFIFSAGLKLGIVVLYL